MKTSRPIRARIAPSAILENYRLAKRCAPQSKALAVVKANAYGHGQWRAVEALRRDYGDAFSERTVLVTGADGFMGSHLTDALVHLGANVTAFVRATSSGARVTTVTP